MKIKKYLPFICVIIILIMSICLPYFLLIMQDYSLLNKNVIHYVESNENESQNLSILQKLKFISHFPQMNSVEYTMNNQTFSFNKSLGKDDIDSLYQEIDKLYQLNGIVEISKEDIENYYTCIINTYQQDNIMITIAKVSFSCQNLTINLWFDNDTYQIYQYDIISKQSDKSLKSLDVYNAFFNYLKIDRDDYDHFYSVYQYVNSVEVYINHVNIAVDEN